MGRKTYKYDKILSKKFGKKVFFIRKERSFTQEELAFRIGISPSYLGVIEKGKSDITLSTIKRIAKAFNIDIHELFIFK